MNWNVQAAQDELKADPALEQTFGSLAGHLRIVAGLRRMLDEQRLPHALLFYGPAGVGKRSMAYALLRRIECFEGGEQPDCPCRFCRKLARTIVKIKDNGKQDVRSSWLDLHELKPESGGQQQIRVDEMRETEDLIHMSPLEGRRRFLLVRQAERMNLESANAFLKTLEEPPPHLQIVLTTEHPDQLLATIRSRCAEIRFSPLPARELAEWLDARYGVRENHRLLAQLAEGCPGRALRMIDSNVLERNEQAREALHEFNQAGYRRLTRTADELNRFSDGRAELALGMMFAWYRELLIAGLTGRRHPSASGGENTAATTAASQFRTGPLIDALNLILEAYGWHDRLVNGQLAFENLLLNTGAALRKQD